MLAIKIVPLLLTAGAAVPCCKGDHVIVDFDCLEVVATDLDDCRGLVSVGGVRVEAPQDCPRITKFKVVYYREVDGRPGYKSPPDRYVGHQSAEIATPTHVASVGSFSNQSDEHGRADAWTIEIEDEHGETTLVSGSF